mmetsp:Transcript_9532/g.27105  ORF Transcript_9532/g.27105 Transcript_9532/m.27105 type:complete len:295 (-) Transcript_9532:841-1725(-)
MYRSLSLKSGSTRPGNVSVTCSKTRSRFSSDSMVEICVATSLLTWSWLTSVLASTKASFSRSSIVKLTQHRFSVMSIGRSPSTTSASTSLALFTACRNSTPGTTLSSRPMRSAWDESTFLRIHLVVLSTQVSVSKLEREGGDAKAPLALLSSGPSPCPRGAKFNAPERFLQSSTTTACGLTASITSLTSAADASDTWHVPRTNIVSGSRGSPCPFQNLLSLLLSSYSAGFRLTRSTPLLTSGASLGYFLSTNLRELSIQMKTRAPLTPLVLMQSHGERLPPSASPSASPTSFPP